MNRDISWAAAALAAICAAMFTGPTSADARPQYPSQVPTPYDCETCHLDPNDRLNRNGFGIDFALERGLWVNPAQAGRGMCFLDSDFDGLTNGEELDDPQCLWRPGTRLPDGPTTHPGDGRDPDQCGDGVTIPLAEDCDGELPAGESCQTQGFDEGELGCARDCTFDTRDCRIVPPDMAPPEADMAPPEPDMAPPDAGTPDADETVDAMPDVISDDMMHAIDDRPDALGAMDAMSGATDAMPDAIGDMPDAMSDADAADCRAAPGRAPGGLWLAVLFVGWLRRRR